MRSISKGFALEHFGTVYAKPLDERRNRSPVFYFVIGVRISLSRPDAAPFQDRESFPLSGSAFIWRM